MVVTTFILIKNEICTISLKIALLSAEVHSVRVVHIH